MQLENLVTNTRAISQYTFKWIEVDTELSAEVISSLKKMLYKDEG